MIYPIKTTVPKTTFPAQCATPVFAFLILSFFLFLISFSASAQIPDTLVSLRQAGMPTRMSLHTNGSLYLGGNFDNYNYTPGIPTEGAGTRLLWFPERAAFRTGFVDGLQWNDANIGYFSTASGKNVRASGDGSTAFGTNTTAASSSTFAVGENSVAIGAASIAMGYGAHTNSRQGAFVFGDRSTTDEVRAGVNHSASWRVSGGFRIFTNANLSSGVTIQSGAVTSNWGHTGVIISTSAGAYLTTSGVWTNVSDVNRKHLFEAVSGEDILARLRRISVQKWSYKVDGDSVRHLGPTAQDFHAAFKLGNDEKTIGTIDVDGIALIGIQTLDARTRSQQQQIIAMKEENKVLRQRLDALEKQTGTATAGLSLTTFLAMACIGFGSIAIRSRLSSTKAKN